jgi:biopolymer transport protein ExbD
MKFLVDEKQDSPPEINVVALIDVIFAVLTFFIVTSLTLARTEGLSVNLPGANSGKAQDQTKIVITINSEGAVSLNRKPIDAKNLATEIKAMAVKGRSTMVAINADEKVGHGTVVSIMDIVQQIPDVKLGIATKRK